jgi:hypothetical protein
MDCLPIKRIFLACQLGIILAWPAGLMAQQPLHEKIDELIQEDQFLGVGPTASDSEFMRRVSLDLVGTTPGSQQVREFLADESVDKREKLVRSLVADPRMNRHLATVFDVMWIERTGDKHVTSAEWQKYLYDSFVANKKYDQLVREILAADGSDEKIRAATRFYLARDGEVNRLTRDVGRIFLGMDLQCAQCHDHPLIDSYYQSDYYGIYAFLNRSFLFTAKDKKVFYAEKAEGNVSFKSVFTEEEGDTGPRLPGDPSILEPVVRVGEEYIVKPAKEVRPVPRYSRREQLAVAITAGTNRAFKNNIANRLWAHMLGQGIFNPVDLQHADNAPLNPRLLDLLGDEFAAMDFDIKKFLGEIALTGVYQQSYAVPTDLAAAGTGALEKLASLDAEQQQLSEQLAAARKVFGAESEELDKLRVARSPVREKQAELNKLLGEVIKVDNEASSQLANADASLKAKQEQLVPVAATLASTREAQTLLPDDDQLTTLVVVYQKRHDQFKAELDALATDQATRKTKAAETAAARAEKQQLVDQGNSELAKQDVAVLDVDKRFQESRNAMERFRQLEIRLGKQKQDAEQVVHLNQASRQRQQLAGELEEARRTLDSSRMTAGKLTAAMPGGEQAIGQLEAERTAATQDISRLDPMVQKHQRRTDALATVVEKAELVRDRQQQDKSLAEAVAQLRQARQVEAAQLGVLEQMIELARERLRTAEGQLGEAQLQLENSRKELAGLRQQIPQLEQQLPQLEGELRQKQEMERVELEKTTARWSQRFAVSNLKALQPEEFAWALMQSVGLVEQTRSSVLAELDKNSPMSDEDQADSVKVEARRRQLEEQVHEKLKGNVGQFVTLFGAAAGQPQDDFFSTVDQALFVANGGPIRGWLNPSGNNLAARLQNEQDVTVLAEELYLSVLTRRPSETEARDVEDYLSSRGEERTQAVQEMIWALLASAEFRFNH